MGVSNVTKLACQELFPVFCDDLFPKRMTSYIITYIICNDIASHHVFVTDLPTLQSGQNQSMSYIFAED